LLQGEFAEAYAMHPFAFIAAPIVGGAIAVAIWNAARAPQAESQPKLWQKLPSWLRHKANLAGWLLVLGLLGLWIARFFGVHGGPVAV
jgi:hypothetical protein